MISISADGVREVEMQPDDSLRIVPPSFFVDVYDDKGALRQSGTYGVDEIAALHKYLPASWQVISTSLPVKP